MALIKLHSRRFYGKELWSNGIAYTYRPGGKIYRLGESGRESEISIKQMISIVSGVAVLTTAVGMLYLTGFSLY